MRRLASSLVLATTLMTAALTPGAAVFAWGAARMDCLAYEPELTRTWTENAAVIVVARATGVEERSVRLEPEGFLKGPAQARSIELRRGVDEAECPWARFAEGERYLVFLDKGNSGFEWPIFLSAFLLHDGEASLTAGQDYTTGEDALIEEIRGFTGQFAVPAQSESEGEGIEWATTVLPIAVALGIVFVIGLFLMRIWHRIDPS